MSEIREVPNSDLTQLLEMQRALQTQSFDGIDPRDLQGVDRAMFAKNMILALTDEAHEALQEVGWKPWAKSRHINEDAFKGELIDALHFFLNLCLVVDMDAEEIMARYTSKREKNKKRQDAGYDGIADKCGVCRRALDDDAVQCTEDPLHPGYYICTQGPASLEPQKVSAPVNIVIHQDLPSPANSQYLTEDAYQRIRAQRARNTY